MTIVTFFLMLDYQTNCVPFDVRNGLMLIVIYLCIHENGSRGTVVIKLHDNRIFKALLWIKKSFKSIDSYLGKHALVLSTLALVELILIDQGVIK